MLSVVVPIYNAEDCIAKCLQSLNVAKHKKNIEIVLIDDGSTDKSAEICLDFVRRYSYMRYYRIDNSGVSTARNIGIKVSTGKYIMFVDADDCVNSSYFDVIDKEMSSDNKMLIFGYQTINYSRHIKIDANFENRRINLENASVKEKKYVYYNIGSVVWNKVFNRDILVRHGITFRTEMKTSEDQVFIFDYINVAKTMKFLPDILYYYQDNANGAVHRIQLSYFDDFKKAYLIERKIVTELGLEDAELIDCNKKYIERIMEFAAYYYGSHVGGKELAVAINKYQIKKEIMNMKELPVLYQIKKFLILNDVFGGMILFYRFKKHITRNH